MSHPPKDLAPEELPIEAADGADPRLTLPAEDLATEAAAAEPAVARAPGGVSNALIAALFAVAAIGLFFILNARRLDKQEASLVAPDASAASSSAGPASAPPLILAAYGDEQAAPSIPNTPPGSIPGPQFTVDNSVPVTPSPAGANPAVAAAAASAAEQRLRAPTVVVDLAQNGAPAVAAPVTGAAPASPARAPLPPAMRGLDSNESFAERIAAGGGEGGETARARATAMTDLDLIVPQGATISGVLETAINSDLPGYTRAVVSRDVRSFDGKNVLIPRGSRLIGQYKSAVALGQSRAFVIWTRVIRPDGVSIQIASPGADTLGRGGLDGKVDRHFFRRFGGSILLSVLNAGVAAVDGRPGTTISIGSPAAATSVANSASLGDNIPPTIKVKQGAAITVFVARDLDFTAVGPAR